MLVRNKKVFMQGLALFIGFLVVLTYMFSPSFDGLNAFQASDNLFNSISKGSSYYMPKVLEGAKKYDGMAFEASIFEENEKYIPYATVILSLNGLTVLPGEKGLKVSGDLGALMAAAVVDSDAMFKNDGGALSSKYGMDERQAMFIWWQSMKEIKASLDQQKVFAPATFIAKNVQMRAVEVGYNYYGIEAQSAADRWGILTFALVFYVVYTLWWGYAIFFMFDGLGLEMKSGRKKEK